MEHLAATTIRNRIACGAIKSIDIVRQAFAQIEKSDSDVQAYLTLFKDQALQQAEAIDQKIASRRPVGALAGVPVAVSDNICTAFGPTTCGSKMLQNFHAPYNAHVIEKLLEADAVLVGKTNLDEFAMGSSTEYSGFQQTRNPWNLSYVPGGSSGGSAAAVAARMTGPFVSRPLFAELSVLSPLMDAFPDTGWQRMDRVWNRSVRLRKPSKMRRF